MKYLIIFLSFIVSDELKIYYDSVHNKHQYDSNDYKVKSYKNHGIKKITSEYNDGSRHEIIYYDNGLLKSKGLYDNKGSRTLYWKTCSSNYDCVCEYHDNSGIYKVPKYKCN